MYEKADGVKGRTAVVLLKNKKTLAGEKLVKRRTSRLIIRSDVSYGESRTLIVLLAAPYLRGERPV